MNILAQITNVLTSPNSQLAIDYSWTGYLQSIILGIIGIGAFVWSMVYAWKNFKKEINDPDYKKYNY